MGEVSEEVLCDGIGEEFAFEGESEVVFEGFDEAGVLELGDFVVFVVEQVATDSGVSTDSEGEDFGVSGGGAEVLC
ncbi:MAG: hypothetical protein RIS92_2865 [Verrucomicrobiota bacterium]